MVDGIVIPPPVLVEGDINVQGVPGELNFYKKLPGLENARVGDHWRWKGGVVSA